MTAPLSHAAGWLDKERWQNLGGELGERGGELLKKGAEYLRDADNAPKEPRDDAKDDAGIADTAARKAFGAAKGLLDDVTDVLKKHVEPASIEDLLPRPPYAEFRRLFIHNQCNHRVSAYLFSDGNQLNQRRIEARNAFTFLMWEEGVKLTVEMYAPGMSTIRWNLDALMQKTPPEVWDFGSGAVKTWTISACPEEKPLYGPDNEPAGLPRGDNPVTYHIVLRQADDSTDNKFRFKNYPYWLFYQDRLVQRGRTGKSDGVIELVCDPSLKGVIKVTGPDWHYTLECKLEDLRPIGPDFPGPSIFFP